MRDNSILVKKMKIKVLLNEPYMGMTSGLPTRYIGMIKELYKSHTLYIFAPGNTDLLRKTFPDAIVCNSTDDRPLKKHFSVINFLNSFLFPKKNTIFLPMCDFYQEFSRVVNNDTNIYDLIYYFSLSSYIFCNKSSNNVPEICDLCDSLLRHFIANFKNSRQLKKRIVSAADILYLKRIKKKFVKKSVKLVVTTEKDACYIRRNLTSNIIEAIPNGIDTPEITVNNELFLKKWNSKEILFCGSLNYSPNIDTIRYILQNMWGPLKDKLPDVVLNIVGRDPDATLLEFAKSFQNVKVHSNVPDVFKYYNDAKLLLSPLFSGGGIKNKILEALCTATPVITNREGATGVDLLSGEHGIIRETDTDLIDATVALMTTDLSEYTKYSKNCFELAQKYSWNEIGKRLENGYNLIGTSDKC